MMMTILMTMLRLMTLLMRLSLPESREDPHSGLNKLNEEEAGSEIRGKVEQAVGVLEQVRHTWSQKVWLGSGEIYNSVMNINNLVGWLVLGLVSIIGC